MKPVKILLAAGGTGGHIFPALSVAMEWKRSYAQDEVRWVGTSRSRERELCQANDIPLELVQVVGVRRKFSPDALKAVVSLAGAVRQMYRSFGRNRPDAVLGFGGYVTAPAVIAARLRGIPVFLQEQNAVPGLVNRILSAGARCTFLGFELAAGWHLRGRTVLTGTPVRRVEGTFAWEVYPRGLDRRVTTVLICGGSQGALSMDQALVTAARAWLDKGYQVVWQTGDAGLEPTRTAMGEHPRLFVFSSIPDLYPFYAACKVVVGRSGASTMNEAAYFGLPCVLIPLPWSTENHQWLNAGYGEARGWAVRVRQDEGCADAVVKAVDAILGDETRYEQMSRKALDSAPGDAASRIVRHIRSEIGADA